MTALDIVNALPTKTEYQAQFDADIASFQSQEAKDQRCYTQIITVLNLDPWPNTRRPTFVDTREMMSQTVIDILVSKGYTVTNIGMGHRVAW